MRHAHQTASRRSDARVLSFSQSFDPVDPYPATHTTQHVAASRDSAQGGGHSHRTSLTNTPTRSSAVASPHTRTIDPSPTATLTLHPRSPTFSPTKSPAVAPPVVASLQSAYERPTGLADGPIAAGTTLQPRSNTMTPTKAPIPASATGVPMQSPLRVDEVPSTAMQSPLRPGVMQGQVGAGYDSGLSTPVSLSAAASARSSLATTPARGSVARHVQVRRELRAVMQPGLACMGFVCRQLGNS